MEAVRTHRLRSALTMLGHPDRHRRGDPDRRPRPGRPGAGAGPDQRSSAPTCWSSRRAARPARTGARGGFGSASTLTDAGRRARWRPGRRPGHRRRWPPVSTTSARRSSTARTNWTTTLAGTTPSWQAVRSRAVDERPVPHRGRRAPTPPPVVVLGPDTASELFTTGEPDRPDGHATTGSTLTVDRRARRRSARRSRRRTTTWRSSR